MRGIDKAASCERGKVDSGEIGGDVEKMDIDVED